MKVKEQEMKKINYEKESNPFSARGVGGIQHWSWNVDPFLRMLYWHTPYFQSATFVNQLVIATDR